MRAALAIALLVGSCTAPPKPAPTDPSTMPPMPGHDAGTAAVPSASKVCANLDARLHCTNLWPASTTCSAAVASLKAHTHTTRLLPCYLTAPSCVYAHDTCKE